MNLVLKANWTYCGKRSNKTIPSKKSIAYTQCSAISSWAYIVFNQPCCFWQSTNVFQNTFYWAYVAKTTKMHSWRGSKTTRRQSLRCAFLWTGKICRLGGCSWHDGRTQLACEKFMGQLMGMNNVFTNFPRHRFLEIMRYLCFYLKAERQRNLLYYEFSLASQLWNNFISNFQKNNITVDKQLLSCKARCRLIQNLSNEPDKLVWSFAWQLISKTSIYWSGFLERDLLKINTGLFVQKTTSTALL